MRRAQSASNSGAFVIVVTALIVLYILFLPPQDRADLLGEGSGSSGGGSSGGGGSSYNPSFQSLTLLNERVGHVDYVKDSEVEHEITSLQLGTSSAGSIMQTVNSVYIKASAFDSVYENVSFRSDDLTSDVKLSFNIGKRASGRLIILLNGYRILDDELDAQTSQFLVLPKDILQRYNDISFAISSPGLAFWQVNEYQINNVQVTGTIKDVSDAQGKATFFISNDEIDGVQRALFKFYPDCQSSGRMTISLNDRTLFNGLPDCNVLNKVDINPNSLFAGENEFAFELDDGSILITQALVKLTLEEPSFPTYYFDIDSAFFAASSDDGVCGEIDGFCPSNCEADLDKDCCFEENNDNFWCDTLTDQLGDRCVSFVTASTCGRCDAGYEDDRGRIADACEETCGDDNDGSCPRGCSDYLDKDCCFEDDEDNYWCDDVPFARPLSAVCLGGVEPDERNSCPDRYENDNGNRLSYTSNNNYDEVSLDDGFELELELRFTSTDRKKGILLVNGREIGLDTYDNEFTKDISDYVLEGSNSFVIQPLNEFDVSSLRVRVKRK